MKRNQNYFATLAVLSFTSLSIAFFAQPLLAAPILDQENPLPGSSNPRVGVVFGSTYDVAQVFEVGVTGTLTSVQVYMDKGGDPTENVTLDVRTTTAGVPDTGGILGSATVLPAAFSVAGAYVEFDLTGSNIAVNAGDKLAFVVSSAQDFINNINQYGAWSDFGGNYLQGDSFHGDVDAGTAGLSGWDIIFRTYVEPIPEPATFTLGSLGLLGIIGRRRKHL
jgi:hypothetical protein